VKEKEENIIAHAGYEIYRKTPGDNTYTEGDYKFCIGGTNKVAVGDRKCPVHNYIMKKMPLT
jgi:hypothetical protein